VLELGCGAGRLTGYLSEIAQIAHGIDISPEMVAYCRQAYPAATFSQGDLRDVGAMGRASFDAVFATFNVLDVLSDDERGQVLESIHNVLPAGGLLIMSSHNLAYAPHIGDALHVRYQGLVGTAYHLLQIPRWRRNRRRLLPLERVEPGYSILNDISHDFLALHYYIAPEEQRLQLEEHGFDLIECLDLDGRRLEPGMTAPECPELQYVARRRADGEIATAQ
jgi:SAM-dependent methyltransferase